MVGEVVGGERRPDEGGSRMQRAVGDLREVVLGRCGRRDARRGGRRERFC